jgi:hypothetical protein
MNLLGRVKGMREALVKMKHEPMSREEMVALASDVLEGIDGLEPLAHDEELFDEIQEFAERRQKDVNEVRGNPGRPVSVPVAVHTTLEVVQRKILNR